MVVEVSHLIDRYVAFLKEEGYIQSKSVETAFRQVPRHQLIKESYSGSYSSPDILEIDAANPEHLAMIYSNRAFVIRWDPEPSSSSEPGLTAKMLELLKLQSAMRVLEIGSGSGYNAALMAELVSDPTLITTLDIQEDLVAQTRQRLTAAGYGEINVLHQDGFYGYETYAPYDRVVATVGCSDLSPHWLTQLAADGFMLIPLSHGGVYHCPLVQVEKDNEQIVGRIVADSNFMSIRGGEFPQELWSVSSDDEEGKLVHLIRTVAPDREYPLFQGLKEFPGPTLVTSNEWAGRFEFHYFLASHTRRTFTCWKGTGLGDETSFVLMGENEIQLYGDQAPSLYEELESIYRRWEQLGKPRMTDYNLEFIPLSVVNEQEKDPQSNGATMNCTVLLCPGDGKQDCATETWEVAPSEPDTWVIDRKFFRQIVRL